MNGIKIIPLVITPDEDVALPAPFVNGMKYLHMAPGVVKILFVEQLQYLANDTAPAQERHVVRASVSMHLGNVMAIRDLLTKLLNDASAAMTAVPSATNEGSQARN